MVGRVELLLLLLFLGSTRSVAMGEGLPSGSVCVCILSYASCNACMEPPRGRTIENEKEAKEKNKGETSVE